MTAAARRTAPRGAPLAMIALLMSGWIGARAALWENPFAASGPLLAEALMPRLAREMPGVPSLVVPVLPSRLLKRDVGADWAARDRVQPARAPRVAAQGGVGGPFALLSSGAGGGLDPRRAAAHQLLWQAAFRAPLDGGRGADRRPLFLPPADAPRSADRAAAADRWWLEGWAFWRQGSGALSTSQGRVPIYGASQVGAVLHYRLAPKAAQDPRAYLRAYRALVRGGESEAALGVSARPLARVPVRIAGEARATRTDRRTDLRPSAYAATELAPLALPADLRLEAYAQAGWVGGPGSTVFADAQAGLVREVSAIARATDERLRLSLGAGAWGGAQQGAERIDLGPTMRLDLAIGTVPARISLDWRGRVAGVADPGSGIAATVSTRF
jgi:hypothetical protein